MSDIIIHCFYGQLFKPKEMNSTQKKIMHTGIMDRGFTVPGMYVLSSV